MTSPSKFQINLIDKFGSEKIPIERGNLHNKIESVRKFIEFLKWEEIKEEDGVVANYKELLFRLKDSSLFEGIRIKVEESINRMTQSSISKKTKGYVNSITLVE